MQTSDVLTCIRTWWFIESAWQIYNVINEFYQIRASCKLGVYLENNPKSPGEKKNMENRSNKKICFVSALDLIKYLKQIKQQLLTCAPIFE